jgi:hypothetical protein
MSRFKRKPSPAMIVAILALIVAMAGGAYAAALPKNSVGPKQLKKNAVKTGKIVNGAVTSDKIANSAVTSGKIAGQAVTSGKFFFSSATTLNFPIITAQRCSGFTGEPSNLSVSVPGILATDHVLVTPPPGFADTFTLLGKPDPNSNTVVLTACNTFTAGGGDPDANGGPYKVLVIR